MARFPKSRAKELARIAPSLLRFECACRRVPQLPDRKTHFEQIAVAEVKKIAEEAPMAEDELAYPEWQEPLQLALIETDQDRLQRRMIAAETAIFNRQQVIAQNPEQHERERRAIADALALLRTLKRLTLGYPDWDKP